MADIADGIDITTDLNGQSADAVPYHGNDVPTNAQPSRQESVPEPKGDEKEPSLRDLLSDAFKSQTKQPDVPQADGIPKQPEGTSEAAAPELVKVGDRWHNKDGTFASQAQIDAFNAAAKPQDQGVAPPKWASQLTPLELEQFAALPAETKAFLERTMDGVNQSAERFNEYGTIEQLIGPRREAWAQNGMPPAVAIQQLLALSDFAGQDPSQFVMWFAEQHKLDLDALLDARDAASADGAVPSYVTGLQQEIQQLRNTIDGFTNVNVQQRQQANMATVQAFMDEKDAAGKPLRPYFSEVIDGVTQHVQVIRQQQPFLPERDVLQAAYDFATYSNPTIRAKVQADQQQALKDAAAAEAAKARQAGVSINGGPAGDASQMPNNANRTLREELIHAYNQSTLQ